MAVNEINTTYLCLSDDDRITVWHISVYIALAHKWHQNNFQNPFSITRREIMKLAHISSIATYHKCIRQLQEYRYIDYSPSYDPSLGSLIYLNINSK